MPSVDLRGKGIEDDKVDRGLSNVQAGCNEYDQIEYDVEAVDEERQDNPSST